MNTSSSEVMQSETRAELTFNNSSSSQNSRRKTYPARFIELDQVRGFVGKAAHDCGLKASAVYQVQLAVDEAFTNIIEHAYGGESNEEIDVTCVISGSGLTITLRDCGKTFCPEDVHDPDVEAELNDRQVGGLGLYFIRRLMDEVEFTFDQDIYEKSGCNFLRMVKLKEEKD